MRPLEAPMRELTLLTTNNHAHTVVVLCVLLQ
jgi:hypothetical protein